MSNYIQTFFKVLSDNIQCVIRGNYYEGKTDLNTLGNLALMRIDRKTVTPSLADVPKLTKEQRKELKDFYSPYVRFITDRYHRLYTSKSGGKFYPEYIPEELYAMYIDRYFSDREEARYIDNKCYYYRLFSNVKQPELVAMRVGDTWLDEKLTPIDEQKLLSILKRETEIVLKRAVNSEGGFGVSFINGDTLISDFQNQMKEITCDVVIQRTVKQHPIMSALHKQSVNTMRIVSLMTGGDVKVYATSLKIGVGESRTDNGCQGGIYCGVKPDGYLTDFGILDNGEILHNHPDLKYSFAEQKIPFVDEAVSLVKNAHSFLGHFRLISWDIAIDEKGEAVLIEANLSLGGINNVQICCGPLFGGDTKKILDEVFCGKRKVTTLL